MHPSIPAVVISDVFWEKKEFIQLQPDKSVVLPFVMDCKLETTDSESGWCSASCSVYGCFTPL